MDALTANFMANTDLFVAFSSFMLFLLFFNNINKGIIIINIKIVHILNYFSSFLNEHRI